MNGLIKKALRKRRRDGIIPLMYSTLMEAIGQSTVSNVYSAILFRTGDLVTYHGIQLDTSDERINDEMEASILAANFESQERYLIKKHLPTNIDVIDLGAGIGFTSCYIAGLVDEDSSVIGVEADPNLIPIAERNRELNNADVEFETTAYHSRKESVEFNLTEKFTGNAIDVKSSETTTVSATNIKDLSQSKGLSQFALVMDMEGAEKDLIRNEIGFLKDHCRLLIGEFHGNFSNLSPIFEKSGFEPIDVDDDVVVIKNTTLGK